MIKVCWKCKGPVDTQLVDESVTVGLCQRCYDRFDEAEALQPVAAAPSAVEQPASPSGNWAAQTSPSEEVPVVEVFIQMEPAPEFIELRTDAFKQVEEHKAMLHQKMLDALAIPKEVPEYGTPLGGIGSVQRLLQDISVIVAQVREQFIDTGDVPTMKAALRNASMEVLRRNAPVHVPVEMIAKVVDECIEEAFKDYVAPAPMLVEANVPGA